MPVLQILCDTTVPASYMNFFEDSSKAWMVRYIFSIGQYFSWVHAQHGRFIEKQSSHVVQGHNSLIARLAHPQIPRHGRAQVCLLF